MNIQYTAFCRRKQAKTSGVDRTIDRMLASLDSQVQLLGLHRQLLLYLSARASQQRTGKTTRRADRGGIRRAGPHRVRP